MNQAVYKKCFVGGTFDGMHVGHQAVLSRACAEAATLLVGITSDAFVAKLKSDSKVRPFGERQQAISVFLREKGWQDKVEYIAIDHVHDPAASDATIDSLVVTSDNRHRGQEINDLRIQRGLPPLELLEEPLVICDDGQPVSSTRMRNGEIDAAGHLVLPDHVRPLLKDPLGAVLTGDAMYESIRSHKDGILVAVGDKTAQTCLEAGVVPSISVIDLYVQRKPYPTMNYFNGISNLHMMSVKSGPGYISEHAVAALRSWKPEDKKRLIVVDGEEDLLVLPAVAYLPIGSMVYYGQPNVGLIAVVVTEEKKQHVQALLSQFSS